MDPTFIIIIFLLSVLTSILLVMEFVGIGPLGTQFVISLYLWGVVAGAISVLLYYLVWRQNEPLRQERALRKRLLRLFEILTDAPDKAAMISPESATMKIATAKSGALDIRRSPVMASITTCLFFFLFIPMIFLMVRLPILALVVGIIAVMCTAFTLLTFVRLTKTTYDHHWLWKLISENAVYACKKLGLAETDGFPSTTHNMRQKSAGLYVVLSVLTDGWFLLYWLYALLRDLGVHNATHRDFGRRFLHMIEPVSPENRLQTEDVTEYPI